MDIQDLEFGKLEISDRALAAIAGITVQHMPEIAGLENGLVNELTSMFGKDSNTDGISVNSDGDQVVVDVYIRVHYGTRIPDVALRLQEKVRTALETFAEVTVTAINVYVQAIEMPATEE